MRQLLLLRHARAAAGEPGQSDHARPLDAHGRQAAAALRTRLRALGLLPDVVLVSSARRTLQTLEALAPWDETPIIEPMDGLYLAEPAQLLRILSGMAGTVRSLMVVGHNPGLHELALQLGDAQPTSSDSHTTRQLAAGFPTCALAEFTLAQSWHDLSQPSGRLNRLIVPPHS